MKLRIVLLLSLILTLTSFSFSPVSADGIIIPVPPICEPIPLEPNHPPQPPCPPPVPFPIAQLDIRYHHVTVKIADQVAITHVDQVFYNPNEWPVEGDYVFPLPAGAAVTNFTLWVDGQPVKGIVLDANQARQKYEEIVRQSRDPALLEYADRGAVEAHIFPIPAQGERRIELEYSQALVADNGLVHYVYPLNTEKFSQTPLQSVSVSIEIASSQPIRAVYSPSHPISIDRRDDRHVSAGYEANNILPDTDFSLYYSLGQSEAFHLLTFRNPADPTDPDGFFLALLAPRPELSSTPQPKDILLVLDHSGSMEGEKFRQAQQALRFILQHLNNSDRFNLITFSTSVETYAPSLRNADEAPKAQSWVDKLSAQGSTDINRALLEAASMADRERPTYLIFLTDGLPTNGVTDTQQILANFKEAAPSQLRLFAFGVGYDVDTVLLDTLAQDHHGISTYVKPGDALDEVISGFYAKISAPVLTNLKLDFGSLSTYDIYPDPLPDLFLGSQIVVVGRYRDGGTTDITLTGMANDQTQTLRYPQQSFAIDNASESSSLSVLPRLWATRKVGMLLNQVRLHGPDQETIDQIVALSIRYGIVTPYTSYLVTEPNPLGAETQSRIAHDQFNQLLAQPSPATSGQAAVEKAAGQGAMAQAEAPSAPDASAQNLVRIVGSRTFVQNDGLWTDTAFDPQAMQTTKVSFLSPDYFKLAQSHPDAAAALALGSRVIFLLGKQAFEVVPSDQVTAPLNLAPTPTQSANPLASSTPVPASTASANSPTLNPTLPSAPSSSPSGIPILPIAGITILAAGFIILLARRIK